jgi:hypothetical protein
MQSGPYCSLPVPTTSNLESQSISGRDAGRFAGKSYSIWRSGMEFTLFFVRVS